MNADEEDITYRILPVYRRKCQSSGINVSPMIKSTLMTATDSGKFQQFQATQELGPMQMRALMDAVNELKYEKVKSIKVCKGKVSDEGVRAVTKYLQNVKSNKVEILELIENQINPLGCEFLGKCLTMSHCVLKELNLNDNVFGTAGLKNLAYGLRSNCTLSNVSLKYCGIQADGVIYFQEILANIKTKLKTFIIQGNHIGNQGIFHLLRAVQLNQVLQHLNIADTGLNLLNFVAKNIYVIQEIKQEDIKSKKSSTVRRIQTNEDKEIQSPEENIENVEEVVDTGEKKEEKQKQAGEEKEIEGEEGSKLPNKKFSQIKKKTSKSVKLTEQKQEKEEIKKCTKLINEDDKTLQAEIMRQLSDIMKNNHTLAEYDVRFNPLSNDSALILFEIIQENTAIKSIQFNTNVDYQLRETLDTIMRRRTGRLPKRRGGGGGGKAKKKKK